MSTLNTTNLKHASSASNNIVLDSSGRALIGVSSANANGGILQLSSGITFPATQVLSTDPNTLDDYEEGTWTPSLGGTATYTSRSGNYTKVGRIVTVTFSVQVNTIGTGSTNQVTGLPFSASIIGLGSCYWASAAASLDYITAYITGSTLDFYNSTTATTTLTANGVFGNGTFISGAVTYAV